MTGTIQDYKIIAIEFDEHTAAQADRQTQAHIELQESVKIDMEYGWQPLGAPFFGFNAMYQAVVKYFD